MGAVYLARDAILGRLVALKFLHRSEPNLLKSFLWEAQAQARVDHPNICKVYEAGERAGQPFIAMQYIDGEKLDEAAKRMTIEQRVQVIRDVADGLHAAHKLGLIHRDIKPANILVERTLESALHPYLVDFGLARESAEKKSNTIFSLEGTPYYMSPEQVAGDVRSLDGRTDIFSLGATLYQILTGHLPFGELGSFVDIMWAVVNAQPTAPSELNRRIQADLETIVLKCLEKEPARRYDSAKAVAEDLTRYLAGEPILARRASLFYRVRKKARKHWALVVAGGVALAGLTLMIGTEVRAEMDAAAQQARERLAGELAQELGQDVKEMELFMRYVYALPAHNITPEKEVVRERMRRIEEKMLSARGNLGALAEGAGNYALGCGDLTLHDPASAVARLTLAMKKGYSTPDVLRAIGEAHGVLYKQAADNARHFRDKSAQDAALAQAKSTYLDPARQFLRQSAAMGGTASPYTAALLALYEERFDDALASTTLALAQAPWNYEAKKLEGDILAAQAASLGGPSDHDAAVAGYKRAIAAYHDAEAMATSDPSVYEAEAEAWFQIMGLEKPSGVDLSEAYRKAVALADSAALVDPTSAGPYVKKTWVGILHGGEMLGRGVDPREVLKTAIADGEQALRKGGADASVYNAVGLGYFFTAIYDSGFGKDVRAPLEEAIRSLKRAIDLTPGSAWAWNDIAITYGALADQAAAWGGEPVPYWEKAAEGLKKSLELKQHDQAPNSNLGWVLVLQSRWEIDHGHDPSELLSRAREHLGTALKLVPDSVNARSNLGFAVLVAAKLAHLKGASAKELIAESIGIFNQALENSPTFVEAKQGRVDATLLSAEAAIDEGGDPSGPLKEARAAISTLLTERATDPLVALAKADLDLLAAREEAAKKGSPGRQLDDALASLAKAKALNAPPVSVLAMKAEVHRRRADWAAAHGQSPNADIMAGRAAIDEARRIDPKLPALDALGGALSLAEARANKKASDKHEAAGRALSALRSALKENPFLERRYGPLAREAEQMAK